MIITHTNLVLYLLSVLWFLYGSLSGSKLRLDRSERICALKWMYKYGTGYFNLINKNGIQYFWEVFLKLMTATINRRGQNIHGQFYQTIGQSTSLDRSLCLVAVERESPVQTLNARSPFFSLHTPIDLWYCGGLFTINSDSLIAYTWVWRVKVCLDIDLISSTTSVSMITHWRENIGVLNIYLSFSSSYSRTPALKNIQAERVRYPHFSIISLTACTRI